MKNLISVLTFFLVCVGSPYLGFGAESQFDASPPDIKSRSVDVNYHFAAKSLYEQEAKPLELKIQRLMQRIQLYDRKPYLDPKGFRRSGLKLRLGILMKDYSGLKQKIALHQELANQILEAKDLKKNNPAQGSGIPD